MAASAMGIIALVWVNMTKSTTPSHSGDIGSHNRVEASSATVALQRSSRTRSPVWSLSQPQA